MLNKYIFTLKMSIVLKVFFFLEKHLDYIWLILGCQKVAYMITENENPHKHLTKI